MNYMEEQYGFDANFVSEIAEYLKCTVCNLVLRQPIQIIKCGHKFCEPCFERIKGYSQHLNTELTCPLDREIIDLNKVFEDNGTRRIIGNLQVKCVNSEAGCMWTGDLRDVKTHEMECQHKEMEVQCDQPRIQEIESGTVASLLNTLSAKVEKCEDVMLQKEKDIAFLKYNLIELKKSARGKDEEVTALKGYTTNIENEMKLMKKQTEETKKLFEREIEVLTLKNQLLENKVDVLGNQLVDAKKILEEKQIEIETIKSEVEEMKKNIDHSRKEMKDEVKVLEDKVINNCNVLVKKEDMGNEVTKLQNNWQKEVEKQKEDMKDIVSHIENIENVIFCDHFDNNRNVTMKWILHNYHSIVGNKIYSPIFYTQIKGYRFQLHVNWYGDKKETLGVFLHLHRGYNHDKELKPFRMHYTLEIPDKKGNLHCHNMPYSTIDEQRENCFTIYPNENVAKKGCGSMNILTMPLLQNYIINDMLTIYCTLQNV